MWKIIVLSGRREPLCFIENIELEIAFQKKLGSGLFGGEEFVMQKLSGKGQAFIEMDGKVVEIDKNEKPVSKGVILNELTDV